MVETTYTEKLKDPRWQRKRLEIFLRDQWACVFCGDTTNTLHIHHRGYIPGLEPWEYPNELLYTVCEKCHEILTNNSTDINKNCLTCFYFQDYNHCSIRDCKDVVLINCSEWR